MFRLTMKILVGLIILSIVTTTVSFFLLVFSCLLEFDCPEIFKKTLVVGFLVHLSCYILYTILLIKQDSKK